MVRDFQTRLAYAVLPFVSALAASAGSLFADSPAAKASPQAVREFLKSHCYDCHRGKEPQAGLDLTKLEEDLNDSDLEERWVRIFDRVKSGEMPPKEGADVEPKDRAAFLQSTSDWLRSARLERDA